MAVNILKRAVALHSPGIVLEFELLPPMTDHPEWGAEITALCKRTCAKPTRSPVCTPRCASPPPISATRTSRPPLLRSGASWEKLRRSFELCIVAGADIVSIESIGGKEVHDPA